MLAQSSGGMQSDPSCGVSSLKRMFHSKVATKAPEAAPLQFCYWWRHGKGFFRLLLLPPQERRRKPALASEQRRGARSESLFQKIWRVKRFWRGGWSWRYRVSVQRVYARAKPIINHRGKREKGSKQSREARNNKPNNAIAGNAM